jgi:hypothetical protein
MGAPRFMTTEAKTYKGRIAKQGSRWLQWVLVKARPISRSIAGRFLRFWFAPWRKQEGPAFKL